MPLIATLLFGLRPMSAFGPPVVTPFAYGRKAAVSLEFDDSMDSQVKNALPLLARYRFQATFYINPGRSNYPAARATWEREVPSRGHELGDHTMHHGDTVGADQAAREIGDAAAVIERVHGRPTLVPFATPGGVKWEIPEETFRRILRENRLFFPGRDDFYQDGQGDILRFPRLALEKETWRKIGFHGIGGEWLSTSVDNLTTLLSYLDAHRGEIWVAPTGTVWKYLREREAIQSLDLRPEGEAGCRLELRFDRTKLTPFELYDVPLTVRFDVPATWRAAIVTIDGQRRQVEVKGSIVEIEVPPSAGVVRVTKA